MPVTLRKLLLPNISGAGKKTPNLRYDPVKKQVIKVNCSCAIPTACNGIGQFQIKETPFVVNCNGTTCNLLGTEFPVSYPEKLAIPGTNFTVINSITVCMVNCNASNVYWINDEPSVLIPERILIPPGQAYVYQPPPYTQAFFITYSFYDSP